ncbi:CHY zinc finger protein [Streptomyces sp. NPDC058740]|uniref:CHY zinc finger protein n=1 Tax=Streptomyces sp. NPDC058740 TaxID=3346619 RepID=UPI0036C0B216
MSGTQDRGEVPAARQGGQDAVQRPKLREVDFGPVENGVDYLRSVVSHLGWAKEPNPRDLKYAVLHLQAAVEVLLKARLQLEHWSLVFKDPGLATRQRFESGDFESCTTTAALARLKEIAGVAVDDKAAKSLAILAKWRNALQHYGLKAQSRAVEARAVQVLDFLLAFVHNQLMPALPEDQARHLDKELTYLRQQVLKVRTYSETRLKRLTGELAEHQARTVKCPQCGEWAVVVGEGWVRLSCRFCHTSWDDPAVLLIYYVLHHQVEPADVSEVCPACDEPGLLAGCTRIAAKPGDDVTLCFSCGTTFAELPATAEMWQVRGGSLADRQKLFGNGERRDAPGSDPSN